MNRELLYVAREYEYNVAGEPPPKGDWQIVEERFHQRGVTVVWRGWRDVPDTIPAPAPAADPEEGGPDA